MTESSKHRDLTEAKQIIDQYTQKCSSIDEGNLYFAATQFEAAHDAALARIAELEKEVQRIKLLEEVCLELMKAVRFYADYQKFDEYPQNGYTARQALASAREKIGGQA